MSKRDIFQGIADPNRRAILELLARNSLTVNGLAEHFVISRPAVSKHIKILAECGLVEMRKQGRERFCEVRLDKLAEVAVWLNEYHQTWEERFDRLETGVGKSCQKG